MSETQALTLDEKLTACPICGSTDIPTIVHVLDNVLKGVLSYSNCQGCGQMFLNPRLSDAQLTQIYKGEYHETLSKAKGFQDRDTMLQRWRASLHAQAGNAWGVVPYTVLDIGCGKGWLLWEWHKRGAKVTGVEPDTHYHSYNPLRRYRTVREIDDLTDEKFDLISMSHSLEHMNHPKEYLQNMLEQCAKDDTKLMIEVPNAECCLTGAWRLWHPFAFTRYTLEKLLDSVGWEIEQHLYHGLTDTKIHRYLLVLARKKKG